MGCLEDLHLSILRLAQAYTDCWIDICGVCKTELKRFDLQQLVHPLL